MRSFVHCSDHFPLRRDRDEDPLAQHGLAGMTVTVNEHLDGSATVHYGPYRIAEFAQGQIPMQARRRRGTPRLPYPKAA